MKALLVALIVLITSSYIHGQTSNCGQPDQKHTKVCTEGGTGLDGGPVELTVNPDGQYSGTYLPFKCSSYCTVTGFHVASDGCGEGSSAPRAQSAIVALANSQPLLLVGCSGELTQLLPRPQQRNLEPTIAMVNPFRKFFRGQGE